MTTITKMFCASLNLVENLKETVFLGDVLSTSFSCSIRVKEFCSWFGWSHFCITTGWNLSFAISGFSDFETLKSLVRTVPRTWPNFIQKQTNNNKNKHQNEVQVKMISFDSSWWMINTENHFFNFDLKHRHVQQNCKMRQAAQCRRHKVPYSVPFSQRT